MESLVMVCVSDECLWQAYEREVQGYIGYD